MALKSTIHKVRLTLSNLNIHHYQDYSLTIAKHPSENDLRMMIRILAFAMSAQEELQFTKGLSSDSEPDIWKINHDGSIEHWIELGLPDAQKQIKFLSILITAIKPCSGLNQWKIKFSALII